MGRSSRAAGAERRTTGLVSGERSLKHHPLRGLLLFVLVLVVPCTSALAGTLRCGSYLIQEGDDAFSVIDKCGEPTKRMTIAAPVYAGSDVGGTHPTGVIAQTELWRYDRGSGSFPAIITIADGYVQSIRFVR